MRRYVWLGGRLVFDRGKVIDEDKGRVVVWVLGTVGAAVARTEVAFGVVGGEGGGGSRGFLRALPGAFGAVGGDEDPAVAQRVVAAVGDVVEDFVRHAVGVGVRRELEGVDW